MILISNTPKAVMYTAYNGVCVTNRVVYAPHEDRQQRLVRPKQLDFLMLDPEPLFLQLRKPTAS